jgi:hypothetical protein
VNRGSVEDPHIATRLQGVTEELRKVEQLLPGAELASGILADFREALNRVRNTTWAMQQYGEVKAAEEDPDALLSVLAGERIRVAYQLCKFIQADLENPHIKFQKGPLLQLQEAVRQLSDKLTRATGE